MPMPPAKGPRIKPMEAPPSRWAVVPPTTGQFIIIAAKKSAVSRPIIGTCFSVSFTFLRHIAQNIIVMINAGMKTVGVK